MLFTKTRLSLLNRAHVLVGEGYLSTLQVRDVLHTRALEEDEVAVFVTDVFDANCTAHEPFQDFLGECTNTCIRWKKKYVDEVVQPAIDESKKNGQSSGNCFDAFEWTEEDVETGTRDDHFIQKEKI